MISENELNLIIIVGIVLVLAYLFMNRSEGLENVKQTRGGETYNPRSFQPAIAEQADDERYIPLPTEAEYPWSKNTGNYGEADILDDGANGNLSFGYNLFSKACCSSQYPPPHSITPSDYVLISGKEYYPTSYKGSSNWEDSGCMCLDKEQMIHLSTRGGNSYSGL
jgi:hypothetical protein